MSKEVKVEAKGLNKKFLLMIVLCIVVVLAAFVLLLPKTGKATPEAEKPIEMGEKYLFELDYEQASVEYQDRIKIDAKREKTYSALVDGYITLGDIEKAYAVIEQARAELGTDADVVIELENKVKALEENSRAKETFYYEIEDDGTITILGVNDRSIEKIDIPKMIDERKVTGIEEFAEC